jgi:NAD(P)H-nitrite reductase large subunit
VEHDLIICRCEEVTRAEILDAIRNGAASVNAVKRWTRAGMGLCQGKSCSGLVSQILAEELGIQLSEILPATARPPVRPVRLGVLGKDSPDED